ncbi:glycoside hydrolase family 19 protein [Mesorhizobium sp. BE184]|uniref:glycoside hydrolase family 19 protein n=1 Tax=Mesorhizobium sp. BE184 TaxID=2817714 RepID=UPI0028620301|nr:glycoside hydrolase family 19 protein [Mesorhizobium sp. BE184]MDR7034480.1 putative chitinase [Mesorhizobium sp. BE184]
MSSIVTAALLRKISKGTPNAANMNSVIVALDGYGAAVGLDLPHRAAQYLPQLLHESGAFKYDREIASGAAYEGRKDLGNTKKGDGVRFKGRTGIQLTGRANYRAFTAWVRKLIPNAPDFEANPDLVNTDPYEGLAPIWYWDVGNPTRKSLNVYADQNNIEMITRKVNGGLNGYDDRLNYYDRSALAMLGYAVNAYRAFQTDARKKGWYDGEVDNDPGPKTRAALHRGLVALTKPAEQPKKIAAAPVVETKEVEVEKKVAVEVPVPVKTNDLDKPWYKDLLGQKEVVTTVAIPGISALGGVPWQNVAIIAGLCVLAAAAYYVIRKRDAAKQEAKVQAVHADAAEAKAAM